MKKYWAILAAALCCLAFAACGGNTDDGTDGAVQRSVTFTQNGESIVKYVPDGGDLTDIPVPQSKTGYTVVWSIRNFDNITEDLTVTAVETPNTYKVYYDIGDDPGASIAEAYTVVTFDAAYTVPSPSRPGYTFTGWVYAETGEAFTPTETYTTAGDTYLKATWKQTDIYVNPFL